MRKSRLFHAMLMPAMLALALEAVPAAAQADDAAYCAVLSDQALRYLASCAIDGANKPDAETRAAIDNCSQGRTAAAIPVLERKLRNNGFSLPGR